jgi:hypothetical protein
MIISAVIYGFLRTPRCGNLSDLDKIYADRAWYLPPILNFLALVPWRESIAVIVALAAYLRASKLPRWGKGWEAYLEGRRKHRTNRMIAGCGYRRCGAPSGRDRALAVERRGQRLGHGVVFAGKAKAAGHGSSSLVGEGASHDPGACLQPN